MARGTGELVSVTAAAVIVTEESAREETTEVTTARRMALPVRTGSRRCFGVMDPPQSLTKDATRSTGETEEPSQILRQADTPSQK
jgi:hypothetical protein